MFRAHPIRRFALLALLCYLAGLVAAGSTPLLRPQAMELVCSGAGMAKLVVKSDAGDTRTAGPAMDCAVCLGSAPPPVAHRWPDMAIPGQRTASFAPAVAPRVLLARAPLPPRGPPLA